MIETRQADTLEGQRIVVSIDSWPQHSKYPVVRLALFHVFFLLWTKNETQQITSSLSFSLGTIRRAKYASTRDNRLSRGRCFASSTIPEESEGVLLVQETSKCSQLFSLAQNRLNFSQSPMFPSVEVDHRVLGAAILISYDKRKLARIHMVHGLLCDMVTGLQTN